MTKWLRSEQSHIVAITGSKDFIGEQERILPVIATMCDCSDRSHFVIKKAASLPASKLSIPMKMAAIGAVAHCGDYRQ
jgi:hypothetical protein